MKEQTQINHPDYYQNKKNGLEVVDFIEGWDLNFNLGNVVKYIARAGKKSNENKLIALCKASWYLNHEIENVKQELGYWK